MRKFRQIIKCLNIAIVKLLLCVVYIVIITPYRLIIRKPSHGWLEYSQQFHSKQGNMW